MNLKAIAKLVRTDSQAAIQKAESEMAAFGILPKVGVELEFTTSKGALGRADMEKLGEKLRDHMPGIDRIHKEAAGQYELVTKPLSPTEAADHIAAFREHVPAALKQAGLGDISMQARFKAEGKFHNSGQHVNISAMTERNGQMRNLFHDEQCLMPDLEGHVIDSLIKTHGTAGPAYLPSAESFERLSASERTRILDPQSWKDWGALTPTHAGHRVNKGATMDFAAEMATRPFLGMKNNYPSVTSRFRSAENMMGGLGEKALYNGTRDNMLGFEKPMQHRIESRLAGADADPHALIASEMGSMAEAVKNHMRPLREGMSVDPAKHAVVETSKGPHVVDKTSWLRRHAPGFSDFEKRALPKTMEESVERFASDGRMRQVLGNDATDSLLLHAAYDPAIQKSSNQAMREAVHEGAMRAHARLGEVAERENPISEQMKAALEDIPTEEHSWRDRVSDAVQSRGKTH